MTKYNLFSEEKFNKPAFLVLIKITNDKAINYIDINKTLCYFIVNVIGNVNGK